MITLVVYGTRDHPSLRHDIQINAKVFTNPHHNKRLRALTGLDQPVIDEIRSAPTFERRMRDFETLILGVLHTRSSFEVGVYCTGGRHRSVVVANELGARLRRRGIDVDFRFLNPLIKQRTTGVANDS